MKEEQMEKSFGTNRGNGRRGEAAFSFKDLMALVAVLGLLGALAYPALANSKSGSRRAVCANNLSQMGRAFTLWGSEHGGMLPSQILSSEGGTRNNRFGLQNNIWFQFAFLSNELASPKILACPSDPIVKVAGDFSSSSPDGFLRSGYRNGAVSYILGYPYKEDGRLVLSGDWNIPAPSRVWGLIGAAPLFRVDHNIPGFGWLPGVHGDGGNLLFNDGSVIQADDAGLKTAIRAYPVSGDSRSRPNFQYPRGPARLVLTKKETSSTDNNSILRVLAVVPKVTAGSGETWTTILWNSAPGKTYRVQFKADLDEVNWLDLPGDIVATGTSASKNHFVQDYPERLFYRVLLVQ